MKKKLLALVAVLLVLAGLGFAFWEEILDLLPVDQSGWKEEDGRVYYANEKGDPLTGLQTLEGNTYYFAPDGTATTGWVELEGKRYYFGEDGICCRGWQELAGKRYLLTDAGYAHTGWLDTEEGRLCFSARGELLCGWQELEGKRYFFDENGFLQTGFVTLEGKTYYMDPEGVIPTGWFTLEGKTYYLDEEGAVVTGFVDTPEGTVLLGEDGILTSGWVDWNGKQFFLDDKGIPLTGWQEIDGIPCLFEENGARYIGFLELEGHRKYLTEKGFAKGILETEEGTFYFDQWGKQILLVNPWNSLPEDFRADLEYHPEFDGYLDRSCRRALDLMLADARKEGVDPVVISGWRSWEVQQISFDSMVERCMRQGYSWEEAYAMTATVVAVPGTSEHQLGLAFDIVDGNYSELNEQQELTETQMWLIENCWEYGFILRYPKDTMSLTGIIYEPWHYRYVGQELSMELCRRGLICLEQYLLDITE